MDQNDQQIVLTSTLRKYGEIIVRPRVLGEIFWSLNIFYTQRHMFNTKR